MDKVVQQQKSGKMLSLFGFFSITASMVMALYEYPAFATSGFSLVFFLLFGGLCWFIPVALCAAEMATVKGWESGGGGLFTWVSQTLGERWGFAAIFFQWFEMTIGFVTILYFIIGSLSYVLNMPVLNENPLLKTILVVAIFWLLSFWQLGGTKNTAMITKIGYIIGILVPAILLIGLSIAYIAAGNPVHVNFSWHSFFPDLGNIDSLVILVSFILSFMGVEASASHVNEMENAGRDYPIAMFLLVALAIGFGACGSMSIACIIPADKINLSAGINQAFSILLLGESTSLGWLVRLIAACVAFGAIAETSAWIVGPARAIATAAQNGLLPKALARPNRHDVPTNFIIFQGVIVTIWSIALTMGGGGNNLSFLAAMALTVVVYLLSYWMLFIGYFALIFRHDDLPRAYQVPGGKLCKCIVAGVGLLASVFSFVISFFPPTGISSNLEYEVILFVGFVISAALPFIVYVYRAKYQ